ncbi:hypothetical protein [Streptomyces sp. NPDC059783]|uniref:hypothetical protein n=1 Tax=Streptomyces sp. NPDC059783 TaxID=3346944 RepID=UPI00364F8BCF
MTTPTPADDRLRAAAQRALESLNDLIAATTDPGVEALGARYELGQALLNTSLARQVLGTPTTDPAPAAAPCTEHGPDCRVVDWTPGQRAAELDTAEAHRLALSEALGLGTGAPWNAIHDRAAELNAALDATFLHKKNAELHERLRTDRAAVLREAEAKAREIVARLWGDGTTQTQLDRAGGARAVEWEIGLMASESRLADEAQPTETEAVPLRGELHPAQLLAGEPRVPMPTTETVRGGKRLAPAPATAATEEPPVVAHRLGGHHPRLHCLRCAPAPRGDIWTPLTSDDLPDGGVCGVCGADVLIPAATEEPQP